MKQIIKNIEADKRKLESKYFNMKKESEVLSCGLLQARKMGKEDMYDFFRNKRTDIQYDMSELRGAINDLANALDSLGHLSESTEIFVGE